MTTDKLFDHSYETVLLDIDIHKIFDSHNNNLFDQYWKMGDEIFNWGKSLMSEIQEMITEQKHHLDQEYENQRRHLENKRQEYIDEALIHKKKNNDEHIRQLITQCDALKFELAAFQYSTRTIPYLTRITQDNLAHELLPAKPKRGLENDAVNNAHAIESSSSKVTSINTKRKSSQRSLIIEFSSGNSQSTIYRDDLVEECPICYMVFSSNLATHHRSTHVNEHFLNDWQNCLTTV